MRYGSVVQLKVRMRDVTRSESCFPANEYLPTLKYSTPTDSLSLGEFFF
jgi:hypothetical protein